MENKKWIEKILEGVQELVDSKKPIPPASEVSDIIYDFITKNYKFPIADSITTYGEIFRYLSYATKTNYNSEEESKRKRREIFDQTLNPKRGEKEVQTKSDIEELIDHTDEKSLTVSEVASKYRCTEQTVTGWIRKGQLKATKIGKSYLIKQSDLDKFEKQNN